MPPVVIKPLNPSDFDPKNLVFSNVITNPEIGNKYCKITDTTSKTNDKRPLIVIRGCIIKTFKKLENTDKDGKYMKGKKDKYQLFMSLKDENFINMNKQLDTYLIEQGVKYSENWFDQNMEEDECTEMFKPTLTFHEKYGYAIGGILANDFICKSTTPDITDVSNLESALCKNTVVDVCMVLSKIKIGVAKYSLGFEFNQINIKSINNGEQYESNAIKPCDFNISKLKLGAIQQHEKGGKFCELLYEDKKFRSIFNDVVGRVFKSDKDDVISYSMSIRLTDSVLHTMFQNIDKEILKTLLVNSKDYYGSKKTEKLLKAILKPLVSYNKADQEKMKKGEKPTYDPSVWIKIWHSDDKGFDGKIINAKKPITNTEDILNKDINISSIEFYSRHIWFGPKGTSINLTLNKCEISYDAPVYDMDDAESDSDDDDDDDDDDDNDVTEKLKNMNIASAAEDSDEN